jgi:voltage-gated potassium channel
MNFFRSPIVRGSALLILVLLIGVLGFYWIEENYTLFDSLYMTVITLSTVGYSEVGNLSEEGKVFTVLFILIGFITVAIALRFIVEYLISDWSLQALKQKKNTIMIKELNQHTIVCGFGRTGRKAVARIKRHRQPYVVIEQDEKLIENWKANVLFQQGNALTEACLHSSGIKKAKHLISALPDDAKNLFVVLTARKLNPALTIVSRVFEEVNQSKLKWAGADHIIMPDKIGGDYMAALLTVPDLIYF